MVAITLRINQLFQLEDLLDKHRWIHLHHLLQAQLCTFQVYILCSILLKLDHLFILNLILFGRVRFCNRHIFSNCLFE